MMSHRASTRRNFRLFQYGNGWPLASDLRSYNQSMLDYIRCVCHVRYRAMNAFASRVRYQSTCSSGCARKALARFALPVLILAEVGSHAGQLQAQTPPNPVISRNMPVFASDNASEARYANDSAYATEWRSSRTPSTSAPVWIAYDLSSVAASRRQIVLVNWSNQATFPYDHTQNAGVGYNLPGSYTIECSASAGGGSPPSSGWTVLATVSGNTFHSRTHQANMSGCNWIQMKVTVVDGSSGNSDVSMNLDIHEATNTTFPIIFYGDSITAMSMSLDDSPVGVFGQLVNASRPAAFPAQQNAGQGGWGSADFTGARFDNWLALFPGKYVGLSLGTNDINGGANDTNAVNAFYTNMVVVVQKVLAAGKIPMIPKIPWARTTGIQSNGPAANAKIDQLYAQFPQIIRGPDLWTLFINNQGLISGDNLHPTAQGSDEYRKLWASTLVAAKIFDGSVAPPPLPPANLRILH